MLVLVFAASTNALFAQTDYEEMKKSFPTELLNLNNFGTEFLLTVPPCIQDESTNGDNKIMIYATSFTRAYITLTGKNGFVQTRELKPYQTAEFILPPSVAQVYLKSAIQPVVPDNVYANSAIKIVSDEPISVYVLVKFNKSSDGYLALPVSTLSNKYIVSSYNDPSAEYPGFYSLPSLTAIVGAYDNTIITFKLGGNVNTNTASLTKKGDSVQYFLNKGDVCMISSLGNDADLTGSVVEASMPVAVISGNQCANVPSGNQFCDYLVEMESPVNTWGKHFHVPIIKGRKFSPVLRIFAKEPDTKVFLDGNEILYIKKAGGQIGSGYQEYRINNSGTAKIGVLSADKPINVVLYNTGVEEDGFPEPLGAPFQMTLIPKEQYQNEILFTTRGINNGTQYFENYLAINYKTENGVMPDDFELGTFDGIKFNWVRLKTVQPVVNQFYSMEGTESWGHFTIPFFVEGVYKLRSSNPFSVYFYGVSLSEAFGFPLYLGTKDYNEYDKEKPHISYNMECNGDVTGWVKDFPEDETMRSNLDLPIFYSDSSYNYDKEFGILVPGKTREIQWKLKVRKRELPARAVILFRDKSANDSLLIVEYFPLKLTISPEYFDFGSLKAGENKLQKFTLTNNSEKPIDFKKLDFSNKVSGFEIVPPTPFGLIQPGSSVEFSIRFNATAESEFADSVGVGDDCQFHFKSYVTARVGNPDIYADDISFKDMTIGKTITKPFRVLNKGKADLKLTSFSGPFSSNFEFNPGFEISSSNPLVIKAGTSQEFYLKFAPVEEGVLSDSIIFVSDATTTDHITFINARGIKPGLAVESYNWERRRIHRQEFPAGPYKISGGLRIENVGSAPLTIKDVVISGSAESKAAFKLDISPIINKRLMPQESITLDPEFFPVSPGEFQIDAVIYDNNDYSVNFSLSGIGVVPWIETESVNFDTSLVGDKSNYKVRNLVISNKSLDEWRWADTLTITSIRSLPDGSIFINNGFGSEGFRINLQEFNFPIKIAPNESITIVGYFSAQKAGDHIAELLPISDTYEESKATLKGFGIDNQLSLSTEPVEICPQGEATIKVLLKNNGLSPLNIGKLSLSAQRLEFSFVNPNDRNGFAIPVGITREVSISFKSDVESVVSDYLVVEGVANSFVDSILIVGKTVVTNRLLTINPVQQIASIGQNATLRLQLQGGTDIDFANITTLSVELLYESDFLVPDVENISIGNDLRGKYLLNNLRIEKNKITFELFSISGESIPNYGEFATITFKVVLPNQDKETSEISCSMTTTSTTCVEFVRATAYVAIKPICALDIRKISSSGINYSLSEIQPNPISSSNVNIDFSVGLNGPTSIDLFDYTGVKVISLVDTFLEKGSYSIDVPVGSLESGIYFYRMNSGPFTETHKMILVK